MDKLKFINWFLNEKFNVVHEEEHYMQHQECLEIAVVQLDESHMREFGTCIKHWKLVYMRDSNYGNNFDCAELIPVEPKLISVTEWEPI